MKMKKDFSVRTREEREEREWGLIRRIRTEIPILSSFFFFWVKREYIDYELIKRKRVALDTSKAKASSTYTGALEKEIKSGLWA